MNARDSFRQASSAGYRQLLQQGSQEQAWWLNRPVEAANVAPYADHLRVWSALVNPVEKPIAQEAVQFDPIAKDHLAIGLQVGFWEG